MHKKTKGATGRAGKRQTRPTREPSPYDLMRAPDGRATATVRFGCELFVRVTHRDYLPHEVVALVRQGQVQMEPVAPGQVGTLILEGFPYTLLGYYTLAVQDASYEHAPDNWSFHGRFYDFYREQVAAIQGMTNTSGAEFEKARQRTRQLREQMDKTLRKRRQRRISRQKTRKV